MEVLRFSTQGKLTIELVLAFCDKDVGFYGATLAFYNGLVVALVQVHQVQLKLL